MDISFYLDNPNLRDYFVSMPEHLQEKLLDNDVAISSLGELQKWADYYSERGEV